MNRRFRGIAAAVGAAALLVAGLAGAKWYVWDVAIAGRGEPDRSMLFWGIPIFMMALVSLAIAAVLADIARRSLLSRPPDGR